MSLKASVVGATGYGGAELLRLLLGHPHVQIAAVVGHGKVGEPIARAIPSLAGVLPGTVEPFDGKSVTERSDVVFCALPHGASAPVVKDLVTRGLPVFDLSADFRLDEKTYTEWYGPHEAPELLSHSVYGLVELHREELKKATLVAVPGCYPTSAVLGLAPLLSGKLISPDGIIVDAKSGTSGAGRSPSARTHHAETAEGVRAYKTGGTHRHTPEIEQELSRVAGVPMRVTFTPHIVPMTRGILATCYVTPLDDAIDAIRCTEAARRFYEGSRFVVVLDAGQDPDTLWVRGSNCAQVSYTRDPRTGRLVVQTVLDNLVKGAAGQAVQCMNVRFGFEEASGLSMPAVWP